MCLDYISESGSAPGARCPLDAFHANPAPGRVLEPNLMPAAAGVAEADVIDIRESAGDVDRTGAVVGVLATAGIRRAHPSDEMVNQPLYGPLPSTNA